MSHLLGTRWTGLGVKALLSVILTAILFLLPSSAFAAGDASVVLEFSAQDQIFLYISLGLGAVAILYGLYLRQTLLKQTPGNEKMQEVGAAIHEGAIAYLKRQFSTMSVFVLVLAVVLFFMYSRTYTSVQLGLFTAISFIAGVLASYFAGFVGMDMAVRGNMRTAAAALTSYGKSLEIAFRSGAVAGMFTVGMGLIGATIIFLAAPKDAMKLLIGFGFGGSLAALFMRVGGGIFTKAADVGADLVGKVEAGIPEDDPRNPATIADNVGDNVGDCAGMAADIFESYEVTLVAAIVLGAATAAIFDQATWMKLVLFALMARGVGIVASIFGVMMVRGSDDLNRDPLKPIRTGFQFSAALAAIMTAALAFWMMGGQGAPLQTKQLTSLTEEAFKVYQAIQIERRKVAEEKKVPVEQVKASDLKSRSSVAALGIPADRADSLLEQFMNLPQDQAEASRRPFKGFKATSIDKITNVVVAKTRFEGQSMKTDVVPFGEAFGTTRLFVLRQTPAANAPVPPGMPQPQPQTFYVLTNDKTRLDEQIKAAEGQNPPQGKIEYLDPKDGTAPVWFTNREGEIAVGALGDPKELRFNFSPQMDTSSDRIYRGTKESVQKVFSERERLLADAQRLNEEVTKLQGQARTRKQEELNGVQTQLAAVTEPPTVNIGNNVGIATQKVVPWWTFAACIAFGIIMAFAIEYLTDYYVSTHKKPVREVAGVSTAGPAPMIIQGFAYGAESSVFSVVAIVVALIMPLVVFNPAEYGSYLLSFYGIALVGLGLLTTTGYILAMDTFGPISDNAQGIFEMSGADEGNPKGARAVQLLDAAGNTTKALTKGFAIATAVVAAVALFHSFVEDARLTDIGMRLEVPEIFLGLLLGGAAPFLFSAFSINAVGRSAFELINEVRRQFRNDPGIMAGTSKPNYGACVAIVTKAAQKELLGPGVLAIALPVAVGFGFAIGKEPTFVNGVALNLVGAQALGGFLAGCILSGQLMAVLLANSGGMWDNAKKLIEDGLYGGKGSEAHKAAVVCDTVGDPFKDTAGPALNPLIKVMNLVALLIAPVVITPQPLAIQLGVTGVCVAALAFSIFWSKRGSMSSEMNAASSSSALPDVSGAKIVSDEPDAIMDGKSAKELPGTKERGRITVDDE